MIKNFLLNQFYKGFQNELNVKNKISLNFYNDYRELDKNRLGCAYNNHSEYLDLSKCSDKHHLRKSSRTGVKMSHQQNDIYFRPNNNSDCLSEGSSQPINVGTDIIRVDKQVSSKSNKGNKTNKNERIRRSRKVKFTSNTNLTSISNRHSLNEKSKENKSRFKKISIDGNIKPKKKNDLTECESDSSASSHDVMESDKSDISSKSTDNIPDFC